VATGAVIEGPAWTETAFYAQEPGEVHAQIAAQRRAAPVYWYEPGGFWVLLKWEHIRFALSHPELFCSKYGHLITDARDPETVVDQLPPFARELLDQPGLTAAEKRGIVARATLSFGMPDFEHFATLDPPEHGEVRSIFMRALRPSLVRQLRPLIAEIADEVFGQIEPDTEVDFVQSAGRVQPSIMAELIGVSRDMRDQFGDWAAAHVRAVAIDPNRDPDEVAQLNAKSESFRDYLGELIDERRQKDDTGDDLISIVLNAELGGAPVQREHYIPFVASFMTGGETTRVLISTLAYALAVHPEARELLQGQPELIPNAIEETLRYYPINWSQGRTATQRIELGGQVIEKDDFVVMILPSGNRDEDVWERPNEYDVTRSFDNEHSHLGFGYGEHSCPGQLLTRVDSSVVLERLLARFPDWELTGEPTPIVSPFVQGIAKLPLTFRTG
jgi:cytochrome P450 family 109